MNLDDLQKICDAATEGPWTHHRQQHCPQINCHEIELRTCHGGALYRSTSYGLMEVDGEFICAARTEMPKLIKRVKNLEAFVDFILRQERTRGYPTGLEWSSIVAVANHEKLKLIDAILEGEK